MLSALAALRVTRVRRFHDSVRAEEEGSRALRWRKSEMDALCVARRYYEDTE